MNTLELIDWRVCRFEQLSAHEVYQIAKLRVDVFVVEQNCAYPELDGQDLIADTRHIVGTLQDVPIAYARILAPKCMNASPDRSSGAAVRIGRVVIDSAYRRQGLATHVMHYALTHCERHFSGCDQTLAAQVSVKDFYAGLGFKACSEPYLEDGIAHVDMIRSAAGMVFSLSD